MKVHIYTNTNSYTYIDTHTFNCITEGNKLCLDSQTTNSPNPQSHVKYPDMSGLELPDMLSIILYY